MGHKDKKPSLSMEVGISNSEFKSPKRTGLEIKPQMYAKVSEPWSNQGSLQIHAFTLMNCCDFNFSYNHAGVWDSPASMVGKTH